MASSFRFSFAFTFNMDSDCVVIETSMGAIKLELYWEHAPKVMHILTITLTFYVTHPRTFVTF